MSVKRIKALMAVILVSLLCISLASCSDKNAGDGAICDAAGIISEADEAKINEAIKNSENTTFFILTGDESTGTKLHVDRMLEEMGRSEDENIVVFTVTYSRYGGYHYYIDTYGTANRRVSDSEIENMLDRTERTVKSGKLGEGLVRCIEITDADVAVPWAGIVIISVIAGIVCGGVVCGVAVAKYKMKMRPTNYPLDKYASLELTDSDDRFINSHVSVKIISSGGGGGRSGGGGGGGGGGHRGGR